MADSQDERRKTSPELAAIQERLDAGDARMGALEEALQANTALTQQIAQNTAGFVAFQEDLASGTRFLCRVVKGIQFLLKDVIDPYWKPGLLAFLAIYWITHDQMLPQWAINIARALFG